MGGQQSGAWALVSAYLGFPSPSSATPLPRASYLTSKSLGFLICKMGWSQQHMPQRAAVGTDVSTRGHGQDAFQHAWRRLIEATWHPGATSQPRGPHCLPLRGPTGLCFLPSRDGPAVPCAQTCRGMGEMRPPAPRKDVVFL